MTPLDRQFEILRSTYPAAELNRRPSGIAIIRVPEIALPPGWSKTSTAIWFVAPVGYPMATPDCFWADIDLRLANGTMPQASNISAIPDTSESLLWFSWHVSKWNPNRDNLTTYARVVEKRFETAQ